METKKYKASTWRNRSPGDLDLESEPIESTNPEPVIEAACKSAKDWARVPLLEKQELLLKAHAKIQDAKEELALQIALDVGKPIREARGELDAVLAKFALTFTDASRYLPEESVTDGIHTASVRRKARGPAAIVGPFNFPLHLAHGAIVPHLIAGNPVIFKPSPITASVAKRYAAIMMDVLPKGVFGLVQGGAQEGWDLCMHRDVRSVSFTGSVPVGKKLANALAEDLGKELALELGGKNALIVCEDSDLEAAANAAADASCLTTGQRCNATSRVFVQSSVAAPFLECLRRAFARYSPGDPTDSNTNLGPLVTANSWERYKTFIQEAGGSWFVEGAALERVAHKRGYYVNPAAMVWKDKQAALNSKLFWEEVFAPIVGVLAFDNDEEAVELTNSSPFGLTASVFTRSSTRFQNFAQDLHVGNVYANLPTTFSPSTLPFGGWKDSGNRRPGGRGFVRFVTDEQAVQVAKGTLN